MKCEDHNAVDVHTPVGWLRVCTDGDAVTNASLHPEAAAKGNQGDPLAILVADALLNYFEGGAWPDTFPLAPSGTPYQEKVWQFLAAIPAGETRTYGEVAQALDTGPRAVGGACRVNPIILLVPCHRVVAANGEGGFSGRTSGPWMDIKRWLLAHEKH